MARLIVKILILLLPLQARAQLCPLWDQYFNNTLAVNPAFAGSLEALSGSVFYRNQWVGFHGAPQNQSLSVHSPVFGERVGLGAVVEANSIGIYKTTNFMGNYAWRMELLNGRLSMGMGLGFTGFSVAWNDLRASDIDDILLTDTPVSFLLPNFSLGMYYYDHRYYLGISIPMLLSYETDQVTGRNRSRNLADKYNYLLTGGYMIALGEGIGLLPSVLFKYRYRHAAQADINAQVILRDMVWIGLGYRNKNNLIGNFQCQLNYQLRLGYSYGFDLGPVGSYTNGSHEVMLNYVFRYREDLKGPRHFGLN
jgi:type IX secretion system PorP/SprF family membrane protein